MAKDPICGMTVDEKGALKLNFKGEAYFFCSRHCMEKFAKENDLALDNVAPAGCRRPLYKNKVLIISFIIISLLALSYYISWLEPFRISFYLYFKTIWWAVLLGLFLGGVIDFFVPREYISFVMARRNKRTIFYSVMLGFLMSACSHGILALSIQLYKKGASTPAVIAFLLASPWANIALTLMLVAFFGSSAFFMISGAIIIAIITGFIYQVLEKHGMVEKNKNSIELDESFSILKDVKKRVRSFRFTAVGSLKALKGVWLGSVALSNMVLWWILLGVTVASLAGAYIPAHIFHNYMGPTFLGLLVTLALATIIEVCSEGSAPMAFEIFRQTGAAGNSFVFLMAGVATDYTEIGLVWTNIGRRAALWLPVITVPQIIALGILANLLFK
ncbi:MAG TPA: permease [Candidatus Omnitrophota bacterium]|nr:permease [Candidatus Omnitrophota bacterium]